MKDFMWKWKCENGTLYSCEECREENERNHKDFHTLNTIHLILPIVVEK